MHGLTHVEKPNPHVYRENEWKGTGALFELIGSDSESPTISVGLYSPDGGSTSLTVVKNGRETLADRVNPTVPQVT